MAPSSRDRISVDLRGLGAALFERAQARHVSVSVLVREAVAHELEPIDGPNELEHAARVASSAGSRVRLSIRLPGDEVARLDAQAREAGLSRAAFVAGLLAGVPAPSGDGSTRLACLAAVTASNAELSTLCRSIHQLTVLLRQGDVPAAQAYRQRLDTLSADVRAHLRLAARVLADLRPARRRPSSGGRQRPATAP